MKEIKSILAKYKDFEAQGLRMALAIVVNVEQSSYRRSGARMLITEDGRWIGGISGGCLEGDTLKKAKHAIVHGKTVKVTYDTRDGDPNQIGIGLGCNGLIDVLITPLKVDQTECIDLLKTVVLRRHPSILVTNLQTGALTDCTNTINGLDQIQNEIESVIKLGRSIMTPLDGGYFIEFLPPPISLFVFGKNYDVIPLAKLAKEVGWLVTIVANPITVSKLLYKTVDSVIPSIPIIESLDQYSVALLMSHDYKTDKNNLLMLQKIDLQYIGILGPKKRSIQIIKELEIGNCSIETSNIYAPMGLDTGATSPEEIAIAIIAEIRSVYSERNGNSLRKRKGTIHS